MGHPGEDLEGFDALFRREYSAIVCTAYAVLGDRQAAEDAAQEAFARLYARWPQVSSYDRPGAWVRRVAIRIAVRQRAKRVGPVPGGAAVTAPPDNRSDFGADFWRALATLSPMQPAAIVLRYLHDLPVADVAAELGCREATARVHLHRARHHLAALLREEEVVAGGDR